MVVEPYMVTAGNHETFNNFSNFNLRFQMPMFEKSQNHSYSYNIGNMHFTSFNLDLILQSPKSKQSMLDWLEKDLKKAILNRNNQPWIIAYTHRPIYCSFDCDDCNRNADLFAEFDSLLRKYDVDLLVSGHTHSYERMLPVEPRTKDGKTKGRVARFQVMPDDSNFNYIVNPRAPVYVVQGASGHRGHTEEPFYNASNFDFSNSYMSVRSANNTHLLEETLSRRMGV